MIPYDEVALEKYAIDLFDKNPKFLLQIKFFIIQIRLNKVVTVDYRICQ